MWIGFLIIGSEANNEMANPGGAFNSLRSSSGSRAFTVRGAGGIASGAGGRALPWMNAAIRDSAWAIMASKRGISRAFFPCSCLRNPRR